MRLQLPSAASRRRCCRRRSFHDQEVDQVGCRETTWPAGVLKTPSSNSFRDRVSSVMRIGAGIKDVTSCVPVLSVQPQSKNMLAGSMIFLLILNLKMSSLKEKIDKYIYVWAHFCSLLKVPYINLLLKNIALLNFSPACRR